MKCPYCGNEETDIYVGRNVDRGLYRRGRKCSKCGNTFYTVEYLSLVPIGRPRKKKEKLLTGKQTWEIVRPMIENLINDNNPQSANAFINVYVALKEFDRRRTDERRKVCKDD